MVALNHITLDEIIQTVNTLAEIFRPKSVTTEIVITDAEQLIGLAIYYRHENGIVFPGVRTGYITGGEYRDMPGCEKGLYLYVNDCEFTRHHTVVHESAFRGFVDPNVIIVEEAA